VQVVLVAAGIAAIVFITNGVHEQHGHRHSHRRRATSN
jgi:zinc and cadmium transporter